MTTKRGALTQRGCGPDRKRRSAPTLNPEDTSLRKVPVGSGIPEQTADDMPSVLPRFFAQGVLLACLTARLTAQETDLRQHQPGPTGPDITTGDLSTRLYIVSDDSMEGREAATRGGRSAEEYLAAEARRIGLTPAGDGGTYFQQIPLVIRSQDTTGTLSVEGVSLRAGQDILLLPRLGLQIFLGGQPYGGTFSGRAIPIVFGGRVGEAGMIDSAETRGKFVIFLAPAGPNGGPLFQFWRRDNLARYHNAAAVGVVTLDGGAPGFFTQPREVYADSTSAWPGELTAFSLSSRAAEVMMGSPLSGLAVGTSGKRVSGTVRFRDRPTDVPARNVIAVLPGRDPLLRHQYVAIGSHSDHIGMEDRPLEHDSIRVFNRIVRPRGADDPPRDPTAEEMIRVRVALDSVRRIRPPRPDSINNGADDDGSGSVLALEIAEALAGLPAAERPRRSVLFIWHTAEEKGLYGSQYFAEHPTVPRDSIVAMINMDQMGRGYASDNPPAGLHALEVIGPRRRSTQLGEIADEVNRRIEHNFTLSSAFDRPGEPTQAWCRSDHFEYARFGTPVIFFVAAAWYLDYHMVSDEPQYIDYDRLAGIGRYIRDVTRMLTDRNHRPVLDQPAPDPNAICRQ